MILLNPHNPRQRQAIAFKLLAPGKEGDTGGATKKVGWSTYFLGGGGVRICKGLLL